VKANIASAAVFGIGFVIGVAVGQKVLDVLRGVLNR
jgi:hypothetical protein